MSCQTTPSEIAACVGAATGLYLVTAIPLMRLARADHLTPRVVRELPVTAAGLLLILSLAAPKEATR